MRRFFQSGLLVLAWLAGSAVAWAQTVQVGGVGSLTPLVQQLAAEFEKTHPGTKVQVMDPPVGSTGSLRALAAGRLDVALSGRPLKDKETGDLRPWVQTALVLATSDAPVKTLDSAGLVRMFQGEVKTWADGRPLRLVLRGAFESETLMLRQLSPALDAAVLDALQRGEAPVADNDLAALEMIEKIQGSLGSTSLGLVLSSHSKVRMIPLNGQTPTVDNLASGRYPWVRPYYLVLRPDASAATRQFVAYLMSAPAFERARRLGYLPLRG